MLKLIGFVLYEAGELCVKLVALSKIKASYRNFLLNWEIFSYEGASFFYFYLFEICSRFSEFVDTCFVFKAIF